MAKKVVKKEAPVEVPEKVKIEEKKSVREIMDAESLEIIQEAEKLRARLVDLQKFAVKNSRPSRHFTHFDQQIGIFVAQFKKMLR